MFLNLHAGELTVRRIPVAKELPSNTVNRIFQDKEGFIWLGTPDGFCRYDGYGMKSFRSEINCPAFPSNNITGGFTEDTLNHTLWIATEKGVLILDKHTHTIVPLDPALLGETPVRQVLFAGDAVWVCSDGGLYLYNLDKSLRKKYLETANSVHVDNRGTVRVTLWNKGMYYLNKKTDTFLPYPPISAGNNPHKIFLDNAGRFWICMWREGLYRFYPDKQGQDMFEHVTVSNNEGFGSNIFYDIEQSAVNDYIWVLSFSGVIVFKAEADRIIPIDEFASSINNLTNLYHDIMKDRDGNLWFGTVNQDVIVTNPNGSFVTNLDLQFIKTQTGYFPNIVTVFEDNEKELWIRQDRIGIFLLNPLTSAIRQLSIPEINSAIAICNNSETGEIWLAVDYVPNICRLRKSNGKVTLTGTINMRDILGEGKKENTHVVRFLHEDRKGAVWAATNNALLSWKSGKWQIIKNNCGTITGITEDIYGSIWVGTAETGLLQLMTDEDKINIKNIIPKAGNNISSISAGNDGKLWFCVNEKQVFSYDIEKRQFTDYSQKVNVNNFVIFNIIAGTDGHIRISGNKHVVEFNPLTGASVQYDAQNDLIVTSLNKNSVATAHDGSIIFGGNSGLCILTPDLQLKMPCKQVKTLITDIKVNGESVYQKDFNRQKTDWQKKIVLYPKETNLEINFSSFNYLHPDQTRYAYKLKGVDKQWVYTEPGRNFAVYNQLRKGEYTFFVRSTGEDKRWSDEITELCIIRKPAFYETTWAYTGYVLMSGFILFMASRFYTNRIKLRNELHIAQMDKEKSEELIQTKLRFFTNIGHEFRTPLTLIMTPLSQLIHQVTDGDLKQRLGSIYRNAEDMLGLINQLLDFRKLEMGGEKLKLSCDDFVKFIRYVYLSFKDVASSKSIQFTFESDVKQLFMNFDKSKVQKIINNLYSNALKFTPEDGYITTTIRIVYHDKQEFVRLDIADSGCGISDKEQLVIFTRFYQSENNDPNMIGSGIGLHLVKEYVELHGGHIILNSKISEGSIFSVFIPVDLSVSDNNVAVSVTDTVETLFATSLPNIPNPENNQEQKTLLIVEDNVELRHFLAEQLGGKFHVLQAANGEQGVDIALKEQPDLIVSDLMMPVLNGFELCQRLKNDIQTSHIPIILLTARLSDESQIESYKVGADSYIAKPFNFEVLLTRIESLIEQQEKRRKNFRKTIEITPSSITTTSMDEEVIKKALQAVEKNMDNSDYSVDELASELALSRRQLSRKFQSIIGLSPGEFIRSVRLKRAVQLLKNSQYNISEIAYMVGFSTAKYFSINFKDEFGVAPTQYRSEMEK